MKARAEVVDVHPVTKRARRGALVPVAAAALVALAACGPQPGGRPDSRLVPGYDQKTGKLSSLEYDRNNDGKVDTWATMDGRRVVRIEIDRNADGKVDRWEFYKAGATPDVPGVLERVESATQFDGRVSRREFMEDGRLARIEEDTDADGAIDKWETYKDGALAVMELDTTHRGKPDRRLVYGPGAEVVRVESDPDGTGRFRAIDPAR